MVDPIVVVDSDPTWPDLFAALRTPVAAALEDVAVAIEHVGSTAVPGLAAKPIIDLAVAIRTETRLPEAIERLARLGYAGEKRRQQGYSYCGIKPRVIEKEEKRSPYSKAFGVNPRTLELHDETGVTERLLEDGWKLEGCQEVQLPLFEASRVARSAESHR